jgi:hypothetical protein
MREVLAFQISLLTFRFVQIEWQLTGGAVERTGSFFLSKIGARTGNELFDSPAG